MKLESIETEKEWLNKDYEIARGMLEALLNNAPAANKVSLEGIIVKYYKYLTSNAVEFGRQQFNIEKNDIKAFVRAMNEWYMLNKK